MNAKMQTDFFAGARFWLALAGILALWLLYTGWQAVIMRQLLPEPFAAVPEILPPLLGLWILRRSGFSRDDLFLQIKPLSRKGALALLVTLPLLLAIFLPGTWTGGTMADIFFYSPLKGITQALFFRCALLPALLRALPGRAELPIFLAALLHGLWHIGPLSLGQPPVVVVSVMAIPFLSFLGWNWQVWHDRTVVWAGALQVLIDTGMSLFTWG